MTHPVKPRQPQRAPAPTRAPARTPVDSGPGQEQPIRSDGPAGRPRINIEAVDEKKGGSMQALTPAEPASGVVGFVESADDEDGDSHLPPCLEQN